MVVVEHSLGPLAVALVLSLASCGGTVKSDPGSSAGAATSGGAPGAVGGSGTASGTAGSVTSSGGSSPAGGGSGGSATSSAGSGGATAGNLCTLPWDAGECDAAMPRYWHNPVSGHCEQRIYGGCGGNQNRFDTLASCIAACHTGENPDVACNQASECELRSPGCCGPCEPIDANDVIAVNRSAATTTCNVTCGACPQVGANESTSRYFIPGCVEHRCTVVDIRETPITQCDQASACALRNTAACCMACGADREPIAYNPSIDPVAAFCGGAATPCPACVGGIPPGFGTDCVAGRCVVEFVPK